MKERQLHFLCNNVIIQIPRKFRIALKGRLFSSFLIYTASLIISLQLKDKSGMHQLLYKFAYMSMFAFFLALYLSAVTRKFRIALKGRLFSSFLICTPYHLLSLFSWRIYCKHQLLYKFAHMSTFEFILALYLSAVTSVALKIRWNNIQFSCFNS